MAVFGHDFAEGSVCNAVHGGKSDDGWGELIPEASIHSLFTDKCVGMIAFG